MLFVNLQLIYIPKSTPYKKNIEVINLLKKKVTISKFLPLELWEEIKKTQSWQKTRFLNYKIPT